jgi:hypothetical protein
VNVSREIPSTSGFSLSRRPKTPQDGRISGLLDSENPVVYEDVMAGFLDSLTPKIPQSMKMTGFLDYLTSKILQDLNDIHK